MSDFGKIAFGIRCGRSGVDPFFFESILNFLLSDGMRPGDEMLPLAIDLPHHWAASVLINEFLYRSKCDSILFLDDDMVFTPQQVNELRDHKENYQFDVVSAVALSRKATHAPLLLQAGEQAGTVRAMAPESNDTTLPVMLVGLAFTLIRRDILSAVVSAKLPGEMPCCWSADTQGEDANLCAAIRTAGGKLAVDCRVAVGHRVTLTMGWNAAAGKAEYIVHDSQPFRRLLGKLQQETRTGQTGNNVTQTRG